MPNNATFPPTPLLASALQTAYDHFNMRLWGQTAQGPLPDCVLLMARKPNSVGYFSPQRWRGAAGLRHEIALNPDHLRRVAETADARQQREGVRRVLSTLVHEMCHLWQDERGTMRPRRAYHNKEFAEEMRRVGLITSDTGRPGGKPTGSRMTHYIQPGGPFTVAAEELLNDGFSFALASFPVAVAATSKQGVRAKYQCGICALQVWGRRGVTDLMHCGQAMGEK